MAERIIDYDRGVIINIHQGSGMDVYMYADDPGVFLNAHGDVISDALAAEAGYDIEKLGKERVRKSRKQQALEMIDAELADDKDVKEEVLEERGGYKMISTGLGRYHVVDPDGNRLTSFPVSEEMAKKLFDGMAPAQAEDAVVKPVVGGKPAGIKKA
jgi:hypothetical protein